MTEFIRIKPYPGRIVPYEPPSASRVPADGCDVVWSPWWARRLADGDIEIVTIPEPAKKPKAPAGQEE